MFCLFLLLFLLTLLLLSLPFRPFASALNSPFPSSLSPKAFLSFSLEASVPASVRGHLTQAGTEASRKKESLSLQNSLLPASMNDVRSSLYRKYCPRGSSIPDLIISLLLPFNQAGKRPATEQVFTRPNRSWQPRCASTTDPLQSSLHIEGREGPEPPFRTNIKKP